MNNSNTWNNDLSDCFKLNLKGEMTANESWKIICQVLSIERSSRCYKIIFDFRVWTEIPVWLGTMIAFSQDSAHDYF